MPALRCAMPCHAMLCHAVRARRGAARRGACRYDRALLQRVCQAAEVSVDRVLELRAAPVRDNVPAGFWADPAPGAGGGEVADAALCLHCPAVRRCRGLLRLLLREAASERLTVAAALESEWLRHV